MKKIILLTICLLFSAGSYALEFSGDVPQMVLRKLLIQGKSSYKGKPIVISKSAKIPSSFQKKWDEKKLSGENIPKIGDESPDVIFVKSF